MFVLVIFSKPYQGTVSTFENHCLEEKLTFGDPFQDFGVEWRPSGAKKVKLGALLPSCHRTHSCKFTWLKV